MCLWVRGFVVYAWELVVVVLGSRSMEIIIQRRTALANARASETLSLTQISPQIPTKNGAQSQAS